MNNIDFKEIIEGIKKYRDRQFFLCAAGAVVVIVLYFSLLFIPKFKVLRKLNTDVVDLRTNIERARVSILKIPHLNVRLKESKEKLEEYKNGFSSHKDIPVILEELSSEAKKLNVKIISISPSQLPNTALSAEKESLYESILINITARCGYKQLREFIYSLESAERFTEIAALKIQGDSSDAGEHTLDMVVRMYVLTQL